MRIPTGHPGPDEFDIIKDANKEMKLCVLCYIKRMNEIERCPSCKSAESDLDVRYDILKCYILELQREKAIKRIPVFTDDGLIAGQGYSITPTGRLLLTDMMKG